MTNTTSAATAPPTLKVTVTFPQPVHDGLKAGAANERIELPELIQRLATDYVLAKNLVSADEKKRIETLRLIVGQAVQAARDICREGLFSESVTYDAITRCLQNPEWVKNYAYLVQDDIYKSGVPLKGNINREIGFMIRAGIGGVTVKGPDGKAATAKVTGSIIQSYTPMQDYDHMMYGPKKH